MKNMTAHSLPSAQGKKPPRAEQRRQSRKDFRYYMQVFDMDTQKLLGHLADINSGGFKLDTQNPIPINKDFRLRLDLTSEIAHKPGMIFVARSRWCKVDPFDPFSYNVGFQLIKISSEDVEIFNRMMEKYGRKHDKQFVDLRHTNIW